MPGIVSYIIERDKEFLDFYKGRYPFYHLSNVFFRDLHYGVMAYLQEHKVKASYPDAEEATVRLANHFEGQKVFRRIDDRTWLLIYPEFKAIPMKKQDAPAKPVPKPVSAPAAKETAAGEQQAQEVSVDQSPPHAEKKNEISPSQS